MSKDIKIGDKVKLKCYRGDKPYTYYTVVDLPFIEPKTKQPLVKTKAPGVPGSSSRAVSLLSLLRPYSPSSRVLSPDSSTRLIHAPCVNSAPAVATIISKMNYDFVHGSSDVLIIHPTLGCCTFSWTSAAATSRRFASTSSPSVLGDHRSLCETDHPGPYVT